MMKYLDAPPMGFALATAMSERGVRGGRRLLTLLDWCGVLKQKAVKRQFGDRFSAYVPAWQREYWNPISYERDLVSLLVKSAHACSGEVTMVDCGADIGLISVAVADGAENISKIVALEPNADAFPVLQRNLEGLPFKTVALQIAASDFTGRGVLQSPDYDASDHARFLMQAPNGDFGVSTIDALELEAENLLIKIDVEGAEIGVIRGAARSLARASKAIVSIEAHPKVYSRNKIEPIEILRSLAAIRAFDFTIAETGKSDIDLARPFFDQQANDGTVYNVVAVSR